MRRYTLVIERGENNYSAYVPDLPGCITTGRNVEEVERLMREAIELHLEGMLEDGEAIPAATTVFREIEVAIGADAA